MLMHPAPPKRQEELAEHLWMWQDKMRRFEARGDQFELANVFKIDALRIVMAGKAEEYFDLWEADRGNTDQAKSYEELLTKVKDYSRSRKLDSSAKEKMQHGGDPMDVGAAGEWSWGECPHQPNCKSKGRGFQVECLCGESGHHPARECTKGKEGGNRKMRQLQMEMPRNVDWRNGVWQVGGEEPQGDRKWDKPEEDQQEASSRLERRR
jgi:hypothetical protein